MSKTSPDQKINEILHLADNALVIGHRNSEWCGHGPVLEQDIAITNISLDLIGQARNFYQYAAELIGEGSTEDKLAYLRDAGEYRNFIMLELPKGDWALTILRQFLFSAYQYYLFTQLEKSSDARLAAIATKSLKEITYHLRWSSEWVIRLGDGTEESHERIKQALDTLWNYTSEFFEDEQKTSPKEISLDELRCAWQEKIDAILEEAGLSIPTPSLQVSGGRKGRHSPHLTEMLAEMQYLQRTYPNSEW